MLRGKLAHASKFTSAQQRDKWLKSEVAKDRKALEKLRSALAAKQRMVAEAAEESKERG